MAAGVLELLLPLAVVAEHHQERHVLVEVPEVKVGMATGFLLEAMEVALEGILAMEVVAEEFLVPLLAKVEVEVAVMVILDMGVGE